MKMFSAHVTYPFTIKNTISSTKMQCTCRVLELHVQLSYEHRATCQRQNPLLLTSQLAQSWAHECYLAHEEHLLLSVDLDPEKKKQRLHFNSHFHFSTEDISVHLSDCIAFTNTCLQRVHLIMTLSAGKYDLCLQKAP